MRPSSVLEIAGEQTVWVSHPNQGPTLAALLLVVVLRPGEAIHEDGHIGSADHRSANVPVWVMAAAA